MKNIKNQQKMILNKQVWCALLHTYFPEDLDYAKMNPKDIAKNLRAAFDVGEKHDIPALLDVVKKQTYIIYKIQIEKRKWKWKIRRF